MDIVKRTEIEDLKERIARLETIVLTGAKVEPIEIVVKKEGKK